MDPFKKTDNEAEDGYEQWQGQIDSRHCQLTVHRIVEGRERTASDQQVYACVVESVCDRVYLYVKKEVLLDIG